MVSTELIPAEKLVELEAKHGRIGVVTHPDAKSWAVVLRKPRRGEYKMFRAHSNNPQRAPDAQENLVKQTCVWPEPAGLEAMLEEWPGIPEACGRMLIELAGMSGLEQGKD
jgi:hypothetical protein